MNQYFTTYQVRARPPRFAARAACTVVLAVLTARSAPPCSTCLRSAARVLCLRRAAPSARRRLRARHRRGRDREPLPWVQGACRLSGDAHGAATARGDANERCSPRLTPLPSPAPLLLPTVFSRAAASHRRTRRSASFATAQCEGFTSGAADARTVGTWCACRSGTPSAATAPQAARAKCYRNARVQPNAGTWCSGILLINYIAVGSTHARADSSSMGGE